MQVFGGMAFYLKNADIVEKLNEIDTIVFDKTGTITHNDKQGLEYKGTPLDNRQLLMVRNVTGNSMHPLSRAVHIGLTQIEGQVAIDDYVEIPGQGISARAGDKQ